MTRRSLLLALAVAACGGTADPEPLDLSGGWSGATGSGNAITLSLSHDPSTDRLSGTWILGRGGVSLSGIVDGHVEAADSGALLVAMRFEGEDGAMGGYVGEVESGGASMRGTIMYFDPGDTEPLTLTR